MPPRLDPEVARKFMVSAGLEPLEPYPGCQKPWRCTCLKCGAEVTPQYANVRIGQGGCVPCADRRISESDAISKIRSAGFDPRAPYPGIREPWLCQCRTCGKLVTPRLHHVIHASHGCAECHRIDAETAVQDMIRAGFEPREPYPGRSDAPWRCLCLTCGGEVSPSRTNVMRARGNGCQACSRRGFDATKPAVVYLVVHEPFGAIKVGIGAADGHRVAEHEKYGWKPVTVIKAPGVHARMIEKSILYRWREELGLPSFLGPQEMPQNGWTETAELDAVNIPETVRCIEALAAGFESRQAA